MFTDMQNVMIARLKDKLDPKVAVMQGADLDRVKELLPQKAPAVMVVYGGYSTGTEVANGKVQGIQHNWIVFVGTVSARGNGDPILALEEASLIGLAVMRALIGLDVGKANYLKLQPAPGAEFDGGFCLLPHAFFALETIKSFDLT